MSEPALAPNPQAAKGAPPQQAEAVLPKTTPEVDLHGRLSPEITDVKLPRAEVLAVNGRIEKLKTAFSAEKAEEYNKRLSVASQQMETIREHSHFFTNSNLDSYSGVLKSTLPEIAKAIEDKDPKALEQALAKLESKLKILEKFISYEKEQGLAGTHAESGVRIYVKNDKIYLCTPDEKAFKDYVKNGNLDSLNDFVKDLTGGAIKFDVSRLQEKTQSGDVTLLGCKINRLELDNSKQDFSLSTKVRKENNLVETRIEFTLAQLKANGLKGQNGVASPGRIPEAHISTDHHDSNPGTVSSTTGVVRPLMSPRSLAMASQESLIPGAVKRVAASATSKLTERVSKLSEYPEKFARGKQSAAIKSLGEAESRIGKIKPDQLTSFDDAVAKTAEVEAKSKGFHRDVKRRLDYLEKELKSAEAGSPQAKKLEGKITKLQELADSEILLRKDLLEKQLTLAGDDATKQLPAKKGLVAIKEDVAAVYTRKITAAVDDAARAPLEAAKTTYQSSVATFETQIPAESPGLGTRTKTYAKAATDGVSSWVDRHPRAKAALDRVKSWGETAKSWGTAKLEVPGAAWAKSKWDQHWEKVEKRSVERTQSAHDSSTKTLAEAVPSEAAGVAKQLKSLSNDGAIIDRRLAALERKKTGGATDLDAEITKLKDQSADITLRRKELVEKQISDLGDTPAAAKLKAKLYDEMGQKIEDAHRHKGQTTEADDFAQKRTKHTEQAESNRKTAELLEYKDIARTVKAREAAEKAHAEAVDGTPLKAERKAALDLATTQEQIAKQKVALQQLEDQLYHNPKDAALKTGVEQAKKEVERLLVEEKTAQAGLTKSKHDTVLADIAEIDRKLTDTASPVDDATRKKLETEKLQAKAKQTELQAELGVQKNASAPTHEQLSDINRQIKEKEASLAKEKDATQQSKIKDEIKALTEEANTKKIALVDAEIQNAKTAKTQMLQAIDDIDAQIKKLSPGDSQIAELQKLKKHLQGKVKGLDTSVEYFEGQAKILDLEKQVAQKETAVAAKRKELADLPDTADAAQKADLKKAIDALDTELTGVKIDLTKTQKQFNSVWTERLAKAKARFNSMVEGTRDYARRNPVKTGIGLAVATESIRGTLMASYEDDAKHPFLIPTLLYSLNRDFEDWSFTTAQGGKTGSMLAEAWNSGANTAIVATSIVGIQRGVVATDMLAAKLTGYSFGQTTLGQNAGKMLATKAAGRAFVGVGSAVDGFLSFSDGSFVNDNATQSAARVTSPILVGAGFGAFFGPPGAIIGAGAGAAGEAGGLLYYSFAQEWEIDSDWRKRGVRDSIRMAEKGFVHSEDSSLVKSRAQLSTEENEAIETFTRDALLKAIFSKDPKYSFTREQLLEAGFKVVTERKPIEGQTKEQILEAQLAQNAEEMEVGKHNWEHAKSLLEGRGWYNPVRWGYGGYIDDLRSKNPELANRFLNVHAECRKHFEGLYRTSMSVVYEHTSDRSKIMTGRRDYVDGRYQFSERNEFSLAVEAAAKEFATKFKDAEAKAKTPQERGALSEQQWTFLATKFPQIGKIIIDGNSRENFVNNFNQYLPKDMPKFNDCAVWKDKQNSEIGAQVMLHGGMVDEIANPTLEALANFHLPQ